MNCDRCSKHIFCIDNCTSIVCDVCIDDLLKRKIKLAVEYQTELAHEITEKEDK